MIDVSERTRSGWSIAIFCTIIPPIDAPTMWADSMPRWSSRLIASAAMSASRYGASTRLPPEGREDARGHHAGVDALELRRQPDVAVVEPDDEEATVDERLEQLVVPDVALRPRPMTNSSGSPSGSPKVS